MSENVTAMDILEHGKLSRGYDPSHFMSVMDVHGDSAVTHSAVRTALRLLDSQRFAKVLDAAHRHYAYSDESGRKALAETYGPEMLRWIAVYGRSQDLLWRPIQEAAGDSA